MTKDGDMMIHAWRIFVDGDGLQLDWLDEAGSVISTTTFVNVSDAQMLADGINKGIALFRDKTAMHSTLEASDD